MRYLIMREVITNFKSIIFITIKIHISIEENVTIELETDLRFNPGRICFETGTSD